MGRRCRVPSDLRCAPVAFRQLPKEAHYLPSFWRLPIQKNKPLWFRNSDPHQHGVAHQVACYSWTRPSKVCINQAFQQPISNWRGIRLGGRSRPKKLGRAPRLQAQVNAFALDHDETRTRRPRLRAAAKLHLCTQTSYHGTEAELWKLKSVQWGGRDTGHQA